jgi:hypothetical protein
MFADMAIRSREKLLQQCVTGLFELGDQELKDTVEYITALRCQTVGQRQTGKDSENEWLTVRQATKRFGVAAALARKWVKSGKVGVNHQNPSLINASDLEDAVEQDELFDLAMQTMERDDGK